MFFLILCRMDILLFNILIIFSIHWNLKPAKLIFKRRHKQRFSDKMLEASLNIFLFFAFWKFSDIFGKFLSRSLNFRFFLCACFNFWLSSWRTREAIKIFKKRKLLIDLSLNYYQASTISMKKFQIKWKHFKSY